VSRRDRYVLILGLLIIMLLIVGYYLLLLGPLLRHLDERAQERSDKQAQLANLQQDVERQLLELSKRIPTQPEIPTLVLQIEEIANASGMAQLSIEPGDPEPPPGGGNFSVVPITMSFEGTYEQMQDFQRRLDDLVRLVTVRSVTFCRTQPLRAGGTTCPAEETATGETTTLAEIEQVLQVEIEAEVYFQPSHVPAGTAPTAPALPETTTQTPPEEPRGT
jgi:type IV pilus assembly protein PilO